MCELLLYWVILLHGWYDCSGVDDEDALLYGETDMSITQQLQQAESINTPQDNQNT